MSSLAFVFSRNIHALLFLTNAQTPANSWRAQLARICGRHISASSGHPAPALYIDVAAEAGITVRSVNADIASKHYIIESAGHGSRS